MKMVSLTVLAADLAMPAIGHPGGAHEYEALGTFRHLAIMAFPRIGAVAVVDLPVIATQREA